MVVVLLALGVTGCAGGRPSVAPTLAPSVGVPTIASATRAPEPSPTSDPPPPSLGEPPAAMPAAEGGDPVRGSLGSFTWGDGGSDSPWLPGSPLMVASGEPLTVRVAADVPVRDWIAKRVRAGAADGLGAAAIADGRAAPISFPTPSAGRWSVQVVVTFGDGLGSAAYYWQVNVR
jgi:hypothetical protein